MASTVSPSLAGNISGDESLQVPRHDNSPTPLPPQTSGTVGLNYYTELNPQFMLQRKWAPEKENIVCAPFNYSISNPGKDFRTQFIHAFQAWLGVPQGSLDIISKAVSLLHEASLLVDDIQDASALRRGAPTAYNIFGIAQTINSANYIYFAALQELQKLDNPAATSIFMEELMNLHRGQGMDLYWRDSLVCPSEDDYLEMVGNKTGGLFRLSVKLMQAEVTSFDLDYVSLANLIGIIFQIRDDYMNLASTQYSQAKGFCEDLTEGKFSLPVIYSVRASPEKPELLNVLKQRTSDPALKCWAVKHMAGMGSLEYTRNVVEILVQKARELTEKVDRGRGQATGIHKILDMVAT